MNLETSQENAVSVTEFTAQLKSILEGYVRYAYVEGELSQLKVHRSQPQDHDHQDNHN